MEIRAASIPTLSTPSASSRFELEEREDRIQITGPHYQFVFSRRTGKLVQVRLEGLNGPEMLIPDGMAAGFNWDLPVQSMEITYPSNGQIDLTVHHESADWRMDAHYEVHRRGYLFCTFSMEALRDQAANPPLSVLLPIQESLFARPFTAKNMENDWERRQAVRGMSLNLSLDERPVTHSVDWLLESVTHDLNDKPPRRVFEPRGTHRLMGWKLSCGWPYPHPRGFRYENRWGLSVTAINNKPNPVRGQRICHWSSIHPAYPSEDLLEELAEYGCSILIMHMPSFRHIDGCEPSDPDEMRRTVNSAHRLGMKILFYCQPYLISIQSPRHEVLGDGRTECLSVWQSLADTQICTYQPTGRYDCDELCLRVPEAFEHIYHGAVECHRKYDFDGLYIDWAWPTQGICNNPNHAHRSGMFNFYDYLRMMRSWRKAIGPNQLMIGHGGGFLVGGDFVEGFDACLTGEAQEKLDPATIGQQFGAVPTLWTLQRRKQDIFRSPRTIEQLIRQGMTPHVGVGVTGTAVIATLDPAHHPEMMALWQMWRAFPVHKAVFYGQDVMPGAIELDNDEILYSLFVTHEGQALLILANEGGPRCDDAPAIGVNVKLNLERLNLSQRLNTWRLKGTTYETFRIQAMEPVREGQLRVQEIGLHEFVGFIFSPDQAPAELEALIKHLEGRPQRMGRLLAAKQKRLAETDRNLDEFSHLPNASVYFSYKAFMKGRVVE